MIDLISSMSKVDSQSTKSTTDTKTGGARSDSRLNESGKSFGPISIVGATSNTVSHQKLVVKRDVDCLLFK